jgi:hypothetical protein
MLKIITLLACVIGFVFLGPKALAEFRQARPPKRRSSTGNGEGKDAADKPQSDVAA